MSVVFSDPRPQGNRVLVARLIPQQTSKGGIVTPEAVMDKQPVHIARVEEVGTEVDKVSVGECVVFHAGQGVDVSSLFGGDTRLLVLNVEQILLKMTMEESSILVPT